MTNTVLTGNAWMLSIYHHLGEGDDESWNPIIRIRHEPVLLEVKKSLDRGINVEIANRILIANCTLEKLMHRATAFSTQRTDVHPFAFFFEAMEPPSSRHTGLCIYKRI